MSSIFQTTLQRWGCIKSLNTHHLSLLNHRLRLRSHPDSVACRETQHNIVHVRWAANSACQWLRRRRAPVSGSCRVLFATPHMSRLIDEDSATMACAEMFDSSRVCQSRMIFPVEWMSGCSMQSAISLSRYLRALTRWNPTVVDLNQASPRRVTGFHPIRIDGRRRNEAWQLLATNRSLHCRPVRIEKGNGMAPGSTVESQHQIPTKRADEGDTTRYTGTARRCIEIDPWCSSSIIVPLQSDVIYGCFH